MKKKLLVTTLALGASLVFTGCGGAPTESPITKDSDSSAESPEESLPPVTYKDATNVEMYKSSDNTVPSVVYLCVGQQGWATTANRTSSGTRVGAPLVRFAEYDSRCIDTQP